MRDAKEIIEDMRTIVKPWIMAHLEKSNYQDMGDSDKKEFCEDFEYILELAEKGADLAAGKTRIKTVATKETELNHIRQFEHELCEFIKSKSAKNENDFEAGMNYAIGFAVGTIWRIYEEGKKHDNAESDSGDRDI